MKVTKIRKAFKEYIVSHNLKSACIGISGGLDSAVNAVLLSPVCRELNIPFIGRYIHIDSNKSIEKETAVAIGNAFCSDFKCVDLTMAWKTFPTENPDSKIRSGNIKARMRMMYLRDSAHIHSGIMIDNTNFTEWNLGFFTIADGGDYSPLFYCWKTEVYQIARELLNECNEEQQIALQKAIDMIPTDGLGISSSDLEQIGAESYEQVDSILQEILAWKRLSLEKRGDKYESLKEMRDAFLEEQQILCYPIEVIIAVTDRHFNSEFKRKQLPIKITRDEI